MLENPEVRVDRYCAIEAQFCNRAISLEPFPSCFLAYPSGAHWVQFMAELKVELEDRGIHATRWEDAITGSVLFKKVCDAIYGHQFTLCEVTDLNPNVLFEAGYSLAIGRDAILLTDKTRTTSRLSLLQTKEQCFYKTRQDIHAWLSAYLARAVTPEGGTPPTGALSVLDMNGIANAQERAGTLYYLRPRLKTQVIGDSVLAYS